MLKAFSNKMGVLGRGALLALMVNIGAVIVGLIVQFVLARLLSPLEFGIYSYCISWLGVGVLFATGGADALLVRLTAQLEAKREHTRSVVLARWALRRGVVWSGTITALTLIFLQLFKSNIAPGLVLAMTWTVLLLPVITLLSIRQAFFRGLKRIVAARLPDIILRPVVFGTLLILAWSTGFFQEMTGENAMLLHLVAGVVALILGFLAFYHQAQSSNEEVTSDHREGWKRMALPLLLVGVLTALQVESDKIALGLLGSLENVGAYSLASRLGSFVTFGSDALMMMAVPLMSEHFASRSREELQRLVSKVLTGMIVAVFPAALIMIACGEYILKFFGFHFEIAYGPLVILCCGQCLMACLGPAGFLLVVKGENRTLLNILGGTTVLGILAYIPAIHLFGMYGAALVSALTLVARAGLYARAAHRSLGVASFVRI